MYRYAVLRVDMNSQCAVVSVLLLGDGVGTEHTYTPHLVCCT